MTLASAPSELAVLPQKILCRKAVNYDIIKITSFKENLNNLDYFLNFGLFSEVVFYCSLPILKQYWFNMFFSYVCFMPFKLLTTAFSFYVHMTFSQL